MIQESHLTAWQVGATADVEEVAEALAIVHAELVLIHPFREGNG